MQLLLNPLDQAKIIEALKELGTPGAAALLERIDELCRETDEMRGYRKVAQLETDDDLEIDDSAVVSMGDDGAWVCAWVWVAAKADDAASKWESTHQESRRTGYTC